MKQKKLNLIGSGTGCLTKFLTHEEQKKLKEDADKKRRKCEQPVNS